MLSETFLTGFLWFCCAGVVFVLIATAFFKTLIFMQRVFEILVIDKIKRYVRRR